jgi:hypothetical protein
MVGSRLIAELTAARVRGLRGIAVQNVTLRRQLPRRTARAGLLACLCLCLLLAALPAQAQAQRPLLPVDQAAAQPDFFSFRAQLQAALARRDVDAVLAVVHPEIKNSFGGNDGIAEFRTTVAPSSQSRAGAGRCAC